MQVYLRCSLVLFCFIASSQSPLDKKELVAKENFGAAYKLPESFTPEVIRDLVQAMVDETHNIGFRYLGEEEDFFHGHVLFTMDELTRENRLKPFAIIYHTQESAKSAHWTEDTPKRYDYLNVQTRNWLQWLGDDLKSLKIENARKYLNTDFKDERLFFEETQPIRGEAFTIHARYLSEKKMAVSVVGELQFEFKKQPCQAGLADSLFYRGPITITMPNGEKICLSLSTRSSFIDWSEWPLKPKKKSNSF